MAGTLHTRNTYKRITTLYTMEHNIIHIPLDQYVIYPVPRTTFSSNYTFVQHIRK